MKIKNPHQVRMDRTDISLLNKLRRGDESNYIVIRRALKCLEEHSDAIRNGKNRS